MRILWGYIKGKCWLLATLGLCTGIFALVLSLYDLPAEAAGYAGLLCLIVLALFGLRDFLRWRRKVLELESIQGQAALLLHMLPEPHDLEEAAYRELLSELNEDRRAAVSARDARLRQSTDYYTMWVHQIKTPIAAMRLLLQGDESEQGRALSAELFRIERYVELVLSYLRLDGGASDYMFRQVDVDAVLRQAARKYAPLFIRGKVSLDLRETGLRVLSDEKWLQLLLEQVLSNAVKYAPGGHVTVRSEGEYLLIQDDGVGIAPEDLPRIFERGFTGYNGRMDKRATGIGLYLCREICGKLGHTIQVASELGKGTCVTIGLARPYLEVE
ncbi:MAG: HAMP domain-containing histidine kinase [Oscillospiraceae bacterium]|jgi:signal transduction histidine kinase|nr:HAMP domain-containing histidine kinase [Oscillospiraceae bacterium]